MFPRLATLLPLAALAAVATAAPNALEARTTNICSSGSPFCCNQAFSGPTVFNSLGGLLSLLGPITAALNAGLTCNPISVIGVGGVSCTSQVACCNNVVTNGLVNVVCSPVNVNV